MVTTLPKPKIGDPCNGCGLCCMISVCRNGAYVQGLVKTLGDTVKGPCPALVNNHDGSYSCGIVLNPKRYIRKSKYREEVLSREFAKLIGAGSGCDEIGYDEDPEEDEKLEEMYYSTLNDKASMAELKNAIRIIHGIQS